MSDKFFFSACVLLGTLLLLIALKPWSAHLPTGAMSAANLDASNLIVENENLNRFEGSDLGKTQIFSENGSYLLKISRNSDKYYDNPIIGPHIKLEADVQQTYSKQNLKITVTARHGANFSPSVDNEFMQFEANYAANANDTSGWQKFRLTPEFADYSFEYKAPDAGRGLGNDFLAIRPADNSSNHIVEIKSVRFQIIP